MRPWWERYQPVSYKLNSRSGTEAEFASMVERCNKAGVRIYVDAVFNSIVDCKNMQGYPDCWYTAPPCGPYTAEDFNGPWDCPTESQNIVNPNDPVQVRNCRIVGNPDLATTLNDTRAKIACYLNKLVSYGVAGIRIDAAKHMWPDDLKAIMGMTADLPTKYFPANSRLAAFQDVMDWGNSPISNTEYIGSGRLCLFCYGATISQAVRGNDGPPLAAFNLPGPSWGAPWLADQESVVFVDNHDTQRGSSSVLTYKDGNMYKMAVGFMLALPFGVARVMSSYYFTDNNQGPPHTANYSIAHVPIYADGSCGGGWVCEHRWPEIAHMVQFRWVTAGQPVVHWTTASSGKVGFGRGNAGFYAINNEGGNWAQTFQTNLPSGIYCDVISGHLSNGTCSGKRFNVGSDGSVFVEVAGGNGIPVVAFHILSRINGTEPTSSPNTHPPTSGVASTTKEGPPTDRQKTVIFLYKPTTVGQNVFIRGGLDSEHNNGCTASFSTDHCKIPITTTTQVPANFLLYLDWSKGDNYLDWFGAEPGQGEYNGQPASGTPLVWSTNDPNIVGYQALNKYGADYWMTQVEMNCTQTESGWFEFKGYLDGWENNIKTETCTGSAGGTPPFSNKNHFARCGYINVFQWGSNACQINSF